MTGREAQILIEEVSFRAPLVAGEGNLVAAGASRFFYSISHEGFAITLSALGRVNDEAFDKCPRPAPIREVGDDAQGGGGHDTPPRFRHQELLAGVGFDLVKGGAVALRQGLHRQVALVAKGELAQELHDAGQVGLRSAPDGQAR
jgi:hypothetical protein